MYPCFCRRARFIKYLQQKSCSLFVCIQRFYFLADKKHSDQGFFAKQILSRFRAIKHSLHRFRAISPHSRSAPLQAMQSLTGLFMRRSTVFRNHMMCFATISRLAVLPPLLSKDKNKSLKVLCTIQLHLADENGVKLDVFR